MTSIDELGTGYELALARCSTVELFDALMYHKKLKPENGPSIQDLVANGLVERFSGARPLFRLGRSLREAARNYWRPGHERQRERAEFIDGLEAWYVDEKRPVERLRLLVDYVADRAEDCFVDSFTGAIRTQDLAVCASLLEIAERSPTLRRLVPTRGRQLAALELGRRFPVEPDYLERPELQDPLVRFVTSDDSSAQVVVLSGRPGLGKSTLLRWLVHDRYVHQPSWPDADLDACAILDMDLLHAERIARYPWLIVLEIARQLDDQLPGRPFAGLLRDKHHFVPLLRRGTSDRKITIPDTDVAAVRHFLTALGESTEGRRLLVVLDTFEQVLQLAEFRSAAMIDVLEKITGLCPEIRVIISTRGVKKEEELLENLTARRTETVEPFSIRETRDYLTITRGIGDPAVIDILTRKAKGSPWHLARGADLATIDRYDADKLARFDIETGWAIERVLKRIDDPVLRRVVLYGSHARFLDKEILADVLVPFIRDHAEPDPQIFPAIDDQHDLDDDPLDPDKLWSQLTSYRRGEGAASTSWLATGPRNTAVLHTQLRVPVIGLVPAAERPRLHDKLLKHFEARTEEESWRQGISEAIYHRVMLQGLREEPLAAGARAWQSEWRDARSRAQSENRPELSVALGKMLLEPELSTYIGTTLRDEALKEIIRAERILAGQHPTRADEHLTRSVAAAAALGTADPVGGIISGAAVALLNQDPVSALAMLKDVQTSDPADEAERLGLVADAEDRSGNTDAARKALSGAREAARALPGPGLADDIAVRLADHERTAGRFDEAARVAQDVHEHPELARLRARIELDLGRPVNALDALGGAGRTSQFEPERAAALLALGRPMTVEEECDEAIQAVSTTAPYRTAARMWRGLARTAMLDIDGAIEDLAEAQQDHRALGDDERAAECAAHLVQIHLRDVGNLRMAAQLLDELPAADRPRHRLWVRSAMLTAEYWCAMEDHKRAARLVESALDTLLAEAVQPPPQVMIDAAVGALSWGGSGKQVRGKAVTMLRTQLTRIQPAEARIAALRDIATLPSGCLPPSLPRTLPTADPDQRDGNSGVRAGRLAELHRAAGNLGAALTEVRKMRSDLNGSRDSDFLRSPYVEWMFIRTVKRIGLPMNRRRPLPKELDVDPHRLVEPLWEAEYPRLLLAACQLTVIELHVTARRNPERCRALLPWVTGILFDPPAGANYPPLRTTSWHLRLLDLESELGVRDVDAARGQTTAVLGLPHAPPPEPVYVPVDELAHTANLGESLVLVVNGPSWTTPEVLLRLPPEHPLTEGLRDGDRIAVAAALLTAVRKGSPFGLKAIQARRADLRIDGDNRAAQLPWELATLTGARLTGARLPRLDHVATVYRRDQSFAASTVTARVLQEALKANKFDPGPIDGYLGPVTRDAIARLKSSRGTHRADGEVTPWVWGMLRRSAEESETHIVTVQTAGGLAAPRDGPVDVLRVVGGMAERDGVPILTLGLEDIDARKLSDALRRLTALGRTPHIVLDIAGDERMTSDTMRRMLLRNEFANLLVGEGWAHSVLATGLAVGGAPKGHAATLDAALREQLTIADVVRLLHAKAESTEPIEDVLPWAGAALFTNVALGDLPALRYDAAPSSGS